MWKFTRIKAWVTFSLSRPDGDQVRPDARLKNSIVATPIDDFENHCEGNHWSQLWILDKKNQPRRIYGLREEVKEDMICVYVSTMVIKLRGRGRKRPLEKGKKKLPIFVSIVGFARRSVNFKRCRLKYEFNSSLQAISKN